MLRNYVLSGTNRADLIAGRKPLFIRNKGPLILHLATIIIRTVRVMRGGKCRSGEKK